MNKSQMININEEYFNSPYYFLIRENIDNYSIYFSINNTLSEAKQDKDVIHVDKKNIKKVYFSNNPLTTWVNSATTSCFQNGAFASTYSSFHASACSA